MSDFNIKSFFKNRFNGNNSLINNVKAGNPWTPWTNQKPVKTEETDETVELEDNNLTLFVDEQIPETGLKPFLKPAEDKDYSIKPVFEEKDYSIKPVLKPAEENNDTAKNWTYSPVDHMPILNEVKPVPIKPVPNEENNDTAKSGNGQNDTPDSSEELLKGTKIGDTIGNWRDWIKPALPADHVAWGNGQKDTNWLDWLKPALKPAEDKASDNG